VPLYSTNAIVTHRTNFGETDRLVTLYTRERGKISTIAKGARKPISRLSGATELLTYGRFQLATGKNLDVITQIEVKESFPRIRADLRKTAYSTYLAELIDKVVEERDPNPDAFDLLLSALYLMERPNDPEKIARMFDLKLMKLVGYEPTLDRCITPQKGLKPLPKGGLHFSPELGGVVCRQYGPLPEDAFSVSREALSTMTTLMAADAPEIERMEIPRKTLDEISRVTRWFIRYRVERELKSLDFIQALKTETKLNRER